MASKMTTTKKVKVVGKTEYINPTTGEYEEFNLIEEEDRDFNFHKLWLGHILQSIDLIGNQKTKLAFWIIEHLDKENKLVYTYDQIQKETGMSRDTIAKTMKALVESNFLEKKHSGCYIVNGTRNGRMNVLIRYKDTKVQAEMKEREKQEKPSEPSEETASDAPESPQTHEKTDAKENVPEESETPKKGKFTRKFTPEPFIEKDREGFPEFVGFPEVCLHAANIRNYLWAEFVYKSEYNREPKLNDKTTDKIVKAFYDNGNPEWWRQFHGKTFQEFCEYLKSNN